MLFTTWGLARILTFEPKAFVMCGVPGAGKTTWAKKLAKEQNACIISGDRIRFELYGNEANQGNWSDIWNRLVDLVSENCHRNIVVDGVHAPAAYRAETLTMLRSVGYREVQLLVLDAPLELALRQNQQRARNVPEYVIRKMYQDLQKGLGGIHGEGFSEVIFM